MQSPDPAVSALDGTEQPNAQLGRVLGLGVVQWLDAPDLSVLRLVSRDVSHWCTQLIHTVKLALPVSIDSSIPLPEQLATLHAKFPCVRELFVTFKFLTSKEAEEQQHREQQQQLGQAPECILESYASAYVAAASPVFLAKIVSASIDVSARTRPCTALAILLMAVARIVVLHLRSDRAEASLAPSIAPEVLAMLARLALPTLQCLTLPRALRWSSSSSSLIAALCKLPSLQELHGPLSLTSGADCTALSNAHSGLKALSIKQLVLPHEVQEGEEGARVEHCSPFFPHVLSLSAFSKHAASSSPPSASIPWVPALLSRAPAIHMSTLSMLPACTRLVGLAVQADVLLTPPSSCKAEDQSCSKDCSISAAVIGRVSSNTAAAAASNGSGSDTATSSSTPTNGSTRNTISSSSNCLTATTSSSSSISASGWRRVLERFAGCGDEWCLLLVPPPWAHAPLQMQEVMAGLSEEARQQALQALLPGSSLPFLRHAELQCAWPCRMDINTQHMSSRVVEAVSPLLHAAPSLTSMCLRMHGIMPFHDVLQSLQRQLLLGSCKCMEVLYIDVEGMYCSNVPSGGGGGTGGGAEPAVPSNAPQPARRGFTNAVVTAAELAALMAGVAVAGGEKLRRIYVSEGLLEFWPELLNLCNAQLAAENASARVHAWKEAVQGV